MRPLAPATCFSSASIGAWGHYLVCCTCRRTALRNYQVLLLAGIRKRCHLPSFLLKTGWVGWVLLLLHALWFGTHVWSSQCGGSSIVVEGGLQCL